MKKVLKTDDVAHKWANQLQEEGRNAGGNFYFHGDTIYSYGSHFPIAKHVEHGGEKAVLFTFRGYSNTTAKQIHITRNASNHLNLIYCLNPSGGHVENFDGFLNSIKGELQGLGKAKKPEKYIGPANDRYRMAVKYAEFFGMEVPQSIKDLMGSVINGQYKSYLIEQAKELELNRIKAEKENIKKYKKALKEWRKGGDFKLYGRLYDRDYLRFNGKRVETSQRVEIPLQIAKNSFKWIMETIKNGGCAGECNYKILDYSVSSVNSDLIIIGCHKIDIKEIKALAKQMKW